MKTFNCTQLSWRLRLSLVLNLESMRLISRFTYKSKDYKRTKDTVYPVHGLAEDYIPDLLRNKMQVLQSLLTGLPMVHQQAFLKHQFRKSNLFVSYLATK